MFLETQVRVPNKVSAALADMPAVTLFVSALGGSFPIAFWAQYIGATATAEIGDALELWWLGYWARQYSLQPHNEVSVT